MYRRSQRNPPSTSHTHPQRHPTPLGVSKLSDANDAGTRNSHQCTLILTEGDSAKSLAMSGLSVVGHDHWGVFPLRCEGRSVFGLNVMT